MSIDMSQFHQVFIEESNEHLDTMEHLLLELDLQQPDQEALHSIFRAAHSIKGGSGIFGFDALTSMTHVMENMLDKARQGQYQLAKDDIDLLLRSVDLLRLLLTQYQAQETPDWQAVEQGTEALEARLNVSQSEPDQGFGLFSKPELSQPEAFGFFEPLEPEQAGATATQTETEQDQGFGFFDAVDDAPSEHQQAEASSVEAALGEASQPEEGSQGAARHALESQINDLLCEDLTPTEADPNAPASKASPVSAETNQAQTVANSPQPRASAAVVPPTQPSAKRVPEAKTGSSKPSSGIKATTENKVKIKPSSESVEASSIRVDTHKVDSLVNLVGELVITQSMLAVLGKELQGPMAERLQTALAELERNTREIQEGVMSIRMLPMSFVFNRFPRVVRDLADKLEKQVDLVIEGGQTEIDKSLIEKLVDPLTHLVRNSIDHGIETPEERRQQGKNLRGKITLSARQQSGNIVISIRDDGAGLNAERILAKAAEQGIALPDNPTDSQIWNLIFAPGFSTAAEVTDVSGRGVGMDVVRRNIQSLGGRVEIESQQGQGSEIIINLPLTLAILDGMALSVSQQTFILPLVNIVESIQPSQEQLKHIANDQLLWLRDSYWPIVPLYQVMNLPDAIEDPAKGILVLIESSKSKFAILVDDLLGQQQVVIKSLEQNYRRVPGVAGATIMGDGSVALILDVESLAQKANQTVHPKEVA